MASNKKKDPTMRGVSELESQLFHQQLKASMNRALKNLREIKAELKALKDIPTSTKVNVLVGGLYKIQVSAGVRKGILELEMGQMTRQVQFLKEFIEDITRVNKWGVRVYKI